MSVTAHWLSFLSLSIAKSAKRCFAVCATQVTCGFETARKASLLDEKVVFFFTKNRAQFVMSRKMSQTLLKHLRIVFLCIQYISYALNLVKVNVWKMDEGPELGFS